MAYYVLSRDKTRRCDAVIPKFNLPHCKITLFDVVAFLLVSELILILPTPAGLFVFCNG